MLMESKSGEAKQMECINSIQIARPTLACQWKTKSSDPSSPCINMGSSLYARHVYGIMHN